MELVFDRDELLEALLLIAGALDRKQTVPVLSNFLFKVGTDSVDIIASDLEVEMKAHIVGDFRSSFEFTVPGRKFLDICKNLPSPIKIEMVVEGEVITIRAGRSTFKLFSLSSGNFPEIEVAAPVSKVVAYENDVKVMLDKTSFCMAQQDVRYYLNGMLVDLTDGSFKTVATDGHRLAVFSREREGTDAIQVILPVKCVIELKRVLSDSRNELTVVICNNHIRFSINNRLTLTSKLIDGRYPDYTRVVPMEDGVPIVGLREDLKFGFLRTSILSNIKFRGVTLDIGNDQLILRAHNPEHEEAVEIVDVQYTGPTFSIGFNVGYLIDVLNAIEEDTVELWIANADSSCLIKGVGTNDLRYVIMPLRV